MQINRLSSADLQLDANHTLLEQTSLLFRASPLTLVDLALATGLTRQTVTALVNRTADPRLSTLTAVLDTLGYELVPVPRRLKREVVTYINNGARAVSLPAGLAAPLSLAQQLYQEMEREDRAERQSRTQSDKTESADALPGALDDDVFPG